MLQMPLGSPGDPGSVFDFALAGSTLLALHYGKTGWGRLHRLDPQTLAPVAEPMRVGHEPRAVVWHPGRNEAYVMNRGAQSYSLTRCALTTGVSTDIPIGFGIIHVALDPVADRIYTADWAHRRVFVIDAADPTQRSTIELPGPPVRLAVAPGGDVLVTLSLKGAAPIDALAVIRPDGTVVAAPMQPAQLQPGAVAVGHDGMVYVGSLGGGDVHPLIGVHDPQTGDRFGAVRAARGVRDLAAHPHLSRGWAATDDGAQMVDTANPYAPQVLAVIPTGPVPYGVAVGEDGTVYVGDAKAGTVSRLDPDLSDVPLEAVSTLLTEAGYPSTGGLAAALGGYQKFHELPVTGQPDTTTVEHLTAPGCGTPDRALSPSFTLLSGHYRHTDLTYYLGAMDMPVGNPDFSTQLKKELLQVSFDEWVKILSENFTGVFGFTQVFDPAEADIIISVGDDPVFHDTGWFRRVYAVTNFPDAPKWPKERAQLPVIFNEAVPWQAPGYLDTGPNTIGVDFRHVATHELGHCLGLDHGSKNSLMARNATWYRVPKGDDRDGLRTIYGRMPFTSARGLEVLPGADHVAYQDCEQHLVVHYATGDGWTFTRLDLDAGARLPARGYPGAPFFAHDGVPAYVYKGDDDHVHQLWFTEGTWWTVDLTVDAGGAPAARTAPQPYRNGPTQRVVYGATDGRIIRLSQAPDQGWVWQDVSQPGAGVPMDSNPFGYVDENTGFDVIAYRDDAQGLRLLCEGPAGWSNLSLSWATEQENPTLLESLTFTGLAPAGEPHRLFALDQRLDVRMFALGADGSWHTRSLTAELGLPESAAIALARTGPSWSLLVTGYVDGVLRELTSDTGESWTVRPVEADGLALANLHGISTWTGADQQHVAYLARNRNLILLSRPLTDPAATQWELVNLTRRSGVL